jgi:hypothetical protein
MSETLSCPVCGKTMRAITTPHIRTHGYADASTFKATFDLTSLKVESIRAKQSAMMHTRNPTAGIGHRPDSIARMKANRRGKGMGVSGKYERTDAIRDRISAGVTRHYQSITPDFGRGWWVESEKADQEVFVRSTWEERVLRVLDLHPCVEEVEVEPFIIFYWLDGRRRRYLPDIHIVLEGGIHEVWEVKPKEHLLDLKNQAKFHALNEYVRERGWNARIVTLSDIEGMEMQVGLRPWVGSGRPWVRLDDHEYRPGSAGPPFCVSLVGVQP